MICERCQVAMDISIEKMTHSERFRKKAECPKCHVRHFSVLEAADKAEVFGPSKMLTCPRCSDPCGQLHLYEDGMVCVRCLCELHSSEDAQNRRVLKSILSY
jgi:hypothetical protein